MNKSWLKPHLHNLSEVSQFLFKSSHIRRLQKQSYKHTQSLYFEGYSSMPMVIFRSWATFSSIIFRASAETCFFHAAHEINAVMKYNEVALSTSSTAISLPLLECPAKITTRKSNRTTRQYATQMTLACVGFLLELLPLL